MAGDAPTTLYAVYAFLEHSLGVGFFQDGERVPAGPLPRCVSLQASLPRFQERLGPLNVGIGHWGLKRYHAKFWTLEEMERDLVWMAKSRLNLIFAAMSLYAGTTAGLAREVCAEFGCPLPEPVRCEGYVSGFPIAWTFPQAAYAELVRETIRRARGLGMRVIYSMRPGEVPMEFKAAYKQFRYVSDTDLWEYAQLHPEEPLYEKFLQRYVEKIISYFGTDHLYYGTPYPETSPESDPRSNYELKHAAAVRFVETLKRLDPQAVWVTDSWDIFWSRDTWTPEAVKAHLDAFDADSLYLYDVNADNRCVPVYAEHGYFHGKTWAFGVMHAGAGQDQLHGQFDHLLERVRTVASDPRAQACSGMFLVPELTHHDVRYYDFLARVAWDPHEVDLDGFFDDYALRRYGKASAARMRRAIDRIVAALYTREMNTPAWKLASLKHVWHVTPILLHARAIPLLDQALGIALAEAPSQQDNPLFENDLAELTIAFLSAIGSWRFYRANAAYAAGRRGELGHEAAACLTTLTWIARILSTRKDFSIASMLDEVMRVPGINPATPAMILRGTSNWEYCANHSYEQVANYFLPRMRGYFSTLERAIVAGHVPIDLAALAAELHPTALEWATEAVALHREIVFDGTLQQAIARGYAECSAALPAAVRAGVERRPGPVTGWGVRPATENVWHPDHPGVLVSRDVVASDPSFGPTGLSMHREWVEAPAWGIVRVASETLENVDLGSTPLLSIHYRIEEGRDPIHLFVNWKGMHGEELRTRVWRSFTEPGRWMSETVDLAESLRGFGDDPRQLLSLEIIVQTPPHRVRIESLRITGPSDRGDVRGDRYG